MSESAIRVLVVEDDDQHATLMRSMLAHSSHDGLFAHTRVGDLRGAVEKARAGSIDVVVLDLNLPDSEGYETYRSLHRAVPAVPIIVLSGLEDEELALCTVHDGAQDYLLKGRVDHRDLARSIRYAIERQQTHEQLEHRVAERTAELYTSNLELRRQIAERERAESALRESNRQLAEAMALLRDTHERVLRDERLLALSRMASGIAHDFNNALAPIQGFSELLLAQPESLSDRERVLHYLTMIHRAARDSTQIVSRLREFYRFRDAAEVLLPVPLNEVIHNVVARTQPHWRDHPAARGIHIDLRTKLQNVPTVSGIASQLGEMITQLVLNAAESIRERGTITIRSFVRDRSVILQVADNGIGMTPEIRERCLEPFFSTKEQHGTGLGLGVAYGIVRRHNAEIHIDSAPGKGTAVTITLPIYRDETSGEKTPHTSGAPAPRRILVAEDEPLVRELIEAYLLQDGHTITLTTNGVEALAALREREFDLVFTDRKMPEMDGDQLAAEVKALHPRLPVVMVTGYADVMSGAGDRPPGVDLVVNKPFNLAMLREAIARTSPHDHA